MFVVDGRRLLDDAVIFLAMGAMIIGCAQGKVPAVEGRANQPSEIQTLHSPGSAESTEVQPPQRRPSYTVSRSTLLVQGQQVSLHVPIGRNAPLPTVLVFHSARGRTESVLQSCDRLAAHGIAAAALDFYDGRVASSHDEAILLRDSANSHAEQLVEVVKQAYDRLQSESLLQSECRFLLGGSFGGAWATFAAGFLPEVKGVVALYGEALTDSPDLYERLHSPIFLIGAKRDTNPAPGQLSKIVKVLREHEQNAKLLILPADHGFIEREHPGYDHKAAETAWLRAIEFIDEQPCSRSPS